MKHAHTEIYTLVTEIGESLVFITAESWIKIKLRLETAGPVAVSTREDIMPALSGKGGLVNNDDMIFVLNKGDRLFYTAQAVNRVRVIIEPIPATPVVVEKSLEPQVPGPTPTPTAAPQKQPRGTRIVRRKPPGKYPRWP